MAYNTVIQQGRFTSTGSNVFIPLRSGVDWMEVLNFTKWGASSGTATGVKFEWQRGLADGAGFEYQNEAGNNRLLAQILTSGGFTYMDTSGYPYAAQNTTVTAISTAVRPIVSLTSTAGLSENQVVIFNNIAGAPQFAGIPWTIDTIVANTSFRLVWAPQLAVGGTTANFYPFNFSPTVVYPNFNPFITYITAITTGSATTRVFLSTTVPYSVGQQVRIFNPDSFNNGMPEINGLSGTITNIVSNATTGVNAIDVNIGQSSLPFTAFAFPAAGDVPFTPATVVPFGEGADASISDPNLLDDAVNNDAQIGMLLAAGVNSPAGQNNDVIYWRAGKSFNV